ncbi:MAG: ribosome assembly factor SBDS [Thermoplasmata archaeon]|nr:ribosome assembly factor SBDS [Thermoplasmata archaeon]
MVSLDDAIVARWERDGNRFEVLVDPDVAFRIKRGEEVELTEDHFVIDAVFKDARKGEHASEHLLEEYFGEEADFLTIAEKILKEGEIHLTTEQRRKLKEEKENQIVTFLVKNCINPQTGAPHPPQRIKAAMEEAKVNVDPFKDVEEQVQEVLHALARVIPIRIEKVKVALKVPGELMGKIYGDVRGMGKILKEEWDKSGAWLCLVEIPAGMQGDFFDIINKKTHGEIETRIVK